MTGAHEIQRTGNLEFGDMGRILKLSFRYCINSLISKKAKYLLLSLVATLQEEIQFLFSHSCSYFLTAYLLWVSSGNLLARIVGRNRIKQFGDSKKHKIIEPNFPMTAVV